MNAADHQYWAKVLDECVLQRKELVRITKSLPELSLADAYAIQDAGIELRKARGEKVVGLKMGLTSKAKMKQMGVDSPIYGVLTDSMFLEAGGRMPEGLRIHPKIEPEVAFRIARPIEGEVSLMGAWTAVESVCSAMEIIDSRYKDFQFELPDVIADNCSSSGFVLGPWFAREKLSPEQVGNLGMVMSVSGQAPQFGSSAAIYGHPLESLRELARMLAKTGRKIEPGMIVLAGGATAAVEFKTGSRAVLEVDVLGKLEIQA